MTFSERSLNVEAFTIKVRFPAFSSKIGTTYPKAKQAFNQAPLLALFRITSNNVSSVNIIRIIIRPGSDVYHFVSKTFEHLHLGMPHL